MDFRKSIKKISENTFNFIFWIMTIRKCFPREFFLSIPLDALSMKLGVGTDKWTFNFICYYFELYKVHKIATNKTK